MLVIKINYYSQKKEKSLKIFTIRLDKIEELSNKFDYDILRYVAINSGKTYDFSTLKDPVSLLEEI